MVEMAMFKGLGDYQKENPQNWMRQFLANKCKWNSQDQEKLWKFENSLEVDSKADTWFKAIPAHERDTWNKLEKLFHARWPPRARVQESTKELYERLMSMKLTEEELDTKVGEEGKETWAHVEWIGKVKTIIDEIGDKENKLVPIVFDRLPLTLRLMLSDEDTETWPKFIAAIEGMKAHRIRDNLALMQRTTPQPPTPTREANTTTLERTPARTTPFANSWRPTYTRYSIAPEQQTPYTTPPPQTPATSRQFNTARNYLSTRTPESEHTLVPGDNNNMQSAYHTTPGTPSAISRRGQRQLALTAMTENKPLPDTPENQRKYAEAITRWEARHGTNANPTWATWHIPLTPGTAPLGSGECFRCGKAGHSRQSCTLTSNEGEIPIREGNWRARIHKALATPNMTMETNDTLPVFIIDGEQVEIDPAVYNVAELDFMEDQGNELGSR